MKRKKAAKKKVTRKKTRPRIAKKKAVRVKRARKHAKKISVLRGALGRNYSKAGECIKGTTLTMGGNMPAIAGRKKSVKTWFRKKRRSRRAYMGSPRGGRVGTLVQNGAVTVGGAAIGSFIAAKLPLPGPMAGFRGLVPVAAGVGLGMTKQGRSGIMSYLALGMVVAGGLAIGRQFAPQFFAGEDEMLGLDSDEALGLVYAGDDAEFDELDGDELDGDEIDGDQALGLVYAGDEGGEYVDSDVVGAEMSGEDYHV